MIEAIANFGKLAGGMVVMLVMAGLFVCIKNELVSLYHRPKLPKKLTRF